jgi:hypothetical protein
VPKTVHATRTVRPRMNAWGMRRVLQMGKGI